MEVVPVTFSNLVSICHTKEDLNISLLLEILLQLLSIENSAKEYPTTLLYFLVTFVSFKNDEDDAALAARVVLKLLEQDVRFEEFLIQNKSKLMQFLRVFLGLAKSHREDEENPDLSKICLGAVGNLSTLPKFGESVEMSSEDDVFKLILDLLHGSCQCPEEFQSTDDESYSLFKGIACLFLGNFATSLENVQQLLSQVPDLISIAMAYFLEETDPFGLQGAHLIKNITVSVDLPYARTVFQHGGVSLVSKLFGMKLFSNLRSLGTHIAKNLLGSLSLNTLESCQEYESIIKILEKSYLAEDSMDIKLAIVLACDVAVAKLVKYEHGPEGAKEVLNATALLANIVIEFLHALYKSGGEVNVVVTLKATKSLGVLSSIPSTGSFLEHGIDKTGQADKIVDILGNFSSQLIEAKPNEKDESGSEVMSKTFKGIINNLGYVGAKLQGRKDLAAACEIAVRNASD